MWIEEWIIKIGIAGAVRMHEQIRASCREIQAYDLDKATRVI